MHTRLFVLALITLCCVPYVQSQTPAPNVPAHKAPAPHAPAAGGVPDPTLSDGDKYHVVLENEFVRVLRYHDEPGQTTHTHHHPYPFVMYALAPFRRLLTFPGGKVSERNFASGEAQWVPAQTHAGQNIGEAPTDGLLIEVKACTPNVR